MCIRDRVGSVLGVSCIGKGAAVHIVDDGTGALVAALAAAVDGLSLIHILAGTALTMSLLKEMLKNPNVVAVKNSSMPTQDIQMLSLIHISARGHRLCRRYRGVEVDVQQLLRHLQLSGQEPGPHR